MLAWRERASERLPSRLVVGALETPRSALAAACPQVSWRRALDLTDLAAPLERIDEFAATLCHRIGIPPQLCHAVPRANEVSALRGDGCVRGLLASLVNNPHSAVLRVPLRSREALVARCANKSDLFAEIGQSTSLRAAVAAHAPEDVRMHRLVVHTFEDSLRREFGDVGPPRLRSSRAPPRFHWVVSAPPFRANAVRIGKPQFHGRDNEEDVQGSLSGECAAAGASGGRSVAIWSRWMAIVARHFGRLLRPLSARDSRPMQYRHSAGPRPPAGVARFDVYPYTGNAVLVPRGRGQRRGRR